MIRQWQRCCLGNRCAMPFVRYGLTRSGHPTGQMQSRPPRCEFSAREHRSTRHHRTASNGPLLNGKGAARTKAGKQLSRRSVEYARSPDGRSLRQDIQGLRALVVPVSLDLAPEPTPS